jgi:hypothetical protein
MPSSRSRSSKCSGKREFEGRGVYNVNNRTKAAQHDGEGRYMRRARRAWCCQPWPQCRHSRQRMVEHRWRHAAARAKRRVQPALQNVRC